MQALRQKSIEEPAVWRFFELKRLKRLADHIGWSVTELARLPGDEVSEMLAVCDAYEDWFNERERRQAEGL